MIDKSFDIKNEFKNHFKSLLNQEKSIKILFYEIFIIGTAYIVGGYFRDFINKKQSRDIDVIVDIKTSTLLDILNQNNCKYELDRQGGIKIHFDTIKMDIWSVDDNWAFKNKLVKLNEDDKLNSIAKGCFYNYDSLVINLHNFSYNLRYYTSFIANKKLDILQSRSIYKNLNPTAEANILRAFYLSYKLGASFSENTLNYLMKKIGSLNDRGDPVEKILSVKRKYPKYDELTDKTLIKLIDDFKIKAKAKNQLFLNV